MPETDELDRIWRVGLASAFSSATQPTDPTQRVAGRVRRRRRARTAITTAGVAALAALLVAAVGIAARPHRVGVAASNPPMLVEVVTGPTLRIHFPGRATSGNPERVVLPHGLLRFKVRGVGGSHRLVIDGVPGFSAAVTDPPIVGGYPDTVTVTVRIPPGQYLMHCTLAGHTEAGEEAILVVR